NLLSTLGLVASIAWLARRPGENTRDVIGATRTWYIAAIVVGNPFTAHVFWMGQTSLIASAAIAGSFVAWRHDRVWIAGLLLAIATLKPQLALLPFGWIAFAGRGPRTALVSLAAAGLLSLWPMVVSGGPIALAAEWLGAVERYQFDPFNQIAFEKMFGVRSLFAVVFGDAPSMLPVGIAGLAMLVWFRSRLNTAEALALLAVLTVSFVYAHDYDLVLLTVAAAPLAYLLEERAELRLWVLAGLLALMVPQRLLRGLESPILLEYREVLVLAIGALVVAEVRWRHATALRDSASNSAT
ncbi:MAG: glycosyltransferase family 87 protein, partial [Myxococcota bacterium]